VAPARWLECCCLEETADAPLHAVAELLASADVPAEQLLSRYGFDSAATLPLVRSLLGLPQEGGVDAVQQAPEREKEVVLETLASLLLSMAREQPVVAVFEDLHWSDPSTRDFLQELLALLQLRDDGPPPRLLLLLTTRDWEPANTSTSIKLPELSRDDVEELVHLSFRGEEPLSPELIERIVEHSEGVPLFVEEVSRKLGEVRAMGSELSDSELIPDFLIY
jgi:predicted ATPase